MATEMELAEQRAVCLRVGVSPVPVNATAKIGIARNVREGVLPINGLRHSPVGDTSGWYIWAGREMSSDPDFFVPIHAAHLRDWCPQLVKFLALPPGYRFLVADNYEDVWQDLALLDA